MNKKISVLYGCNDPYAPFVGVSICSLLENNKLADEIDIYVMSDGISEDNILRIKKQIQSYGAGRYLKIVDSASIIEGFKATGVPDYRGSYAAFLRLAFEQAVGEEVDKLLYLDSDTLVVGDLLPLFEIDLGDNYIGAVADCLGDMVKPLIGFEKGDFYLNSGVLLINVPVWKRDNITRKIIDMIKEGKLTNPSGGDQEYILYATKDKIKVLDPKYNLQPFHMGYSNKQYFKVYAKEGYYSEGVLENSVNNPVILHTFRYLGRFPFHKNNIHPAKTEFEKYKDLSQWADMESPTKEIPLFIKAEIALYHILPRVLFLKIFRMVQTMVLKRTIMNF